MSKLSFVNFNTLVISAGVVWALQLIIPKTKNAVTKIDFIFIDL